MTPIKPIIIRLSGNRRVRLGLYLPPVVDPYVTGQERARARRWFFILLMGLAAALCVFRFYSGLW